MNTNFKHKFKMSNVSATRKFKIQRKWTSEEVKQILDKLKNTIRMGKMVEKPTAEVYYSKMLSELHLICCNVSQIKNKVRNLKKCYTETIQWRNSAGQVILEKNGPESLRAVIISKCPDFDDLDEIFGNMTHINPLCIISSVSSFNPEDYEEDQKSFVFGNNELVSDGEDEKSQLSDSYLESQPSVQSEIGSKIKNISVNGNALSINECRIVKDKYENDKLEMEIARFNFEKEKWQNELELRHRQLDLDEKKLEFEMSNAKFEIELKYSTQLEIAKLNCTKEKI